MNSSVASPGRDTMSMSPRDVSSPQPSASPGSSSGRRLKSFSRRRRSSSAKPTDAEEQQFFREWHITYAEEDEYLQTFARELNDLGVLQPWHDMYLLRRFLRARQHSVPRAKAMFLAALKWREEFGTDTILDDFVFHERVQFITMYPQGYHKTDKMGRPIYIQYVGQIDMTELKKITTEERMIKFHVFEMERAIKYILPACSRAHGSHIDQTFNIIDLKGFGLRHMTSDVMRMLSKITWIDQNMYPEMLGHTCVINAPSMFKAAWSMVKPMLDIRTQQKIEFCGVDHTAALLEWVDRENLMEELGGSSKGTLLEDVGPWNDPQYVAQIDAEWSLNHSNGRLALSGTQ